jgi:hypothetical protein
LFKQAKSVEEQWKCGQCWTNMTSNQCVTIVQRADEIGISYRSLEAILKDALSMWCLCVCVCACAWNLYLKYCLRIDQCKHQTSWRNYNLEQMLALCYDSEKKFHRT